MIPMAFSTAYWRLGLRVEMHFQKEKPWKTCTGLSRQKYLRARD
jgi:hypothetical protein